MPLKWIFPRLTCCTITFLYGDAITGPVTSQIINDNLNRMATSEIIKEFFEERFQNTSQFFLYKDKQLLKKGNYRKYAQEQIKKANKIFWSIAFSIFICSWYGIISFIEYGAGPNWFDLTLGLISWAALVVILLYSAKEYYTIKSSMELFIKLMDNKEKESVT